MSNKGENLEPVRGEVNLVSSAADRARAPDAGEGALDVPEEEELEDLPRVEDRVPVPQDPLRAGVPARE